MIENITPTDRAVSAEADKFCALAKNIVGGERLATDIETRRLYSTDFSEIEMQTAIAVISPKNTEEVCRIISAAAETGVALTARGGGMSYTLGYVPRDDNTAILDMALMSAIKIRSEDRLIEIETGVPTENRIGG